MRTVCLPGLAAFALASSAPAGDLFGVDIGPDHLLTIDRDTAEVTFVGQAKVDPINGLAYDPNARIMYGVQPNDGLYRVDLSTGLATLVGLFGIQNANINGLAFDPIDNILYATDNNSNALYTLNTSTGAATLVAGITNGFTEIEGLGYDSRERILYGLTQLQHRIVTIDVQTGETNAIPGGELPNLIWRGLEFDPERRTLFASAGTALYTVDPATGAFSQVGTMQVAFVQGLAFVPSCYPDFTADGALDLFDFLAFVNAFNAADPAADCDHNALLDLFDFLCFVNAFNQGC